MKKKILYGILVLFLAGAGTAYYLYNKPVASLEHEHAAYALSAGTLYAAYSADESASDAKYLGKVLEVTGRVAGTTTDAKGVVTVNLETGNPNRVSCEMAPGNKGIASLPVNREITVKGICSGMLLDVVLVNCVSAR